LEERNSIILVCFIVLSLSGSAALAGEDDCNWLNYSRFSGFDAEENAVELSAVVTA
jgi:hypothetical protein